MNRIIEGLAMINLESVGIQRNLLVAALLGNLINIPRGIKSKLHRTALVLLSTTLSTIVTPLVLELLSSFGMSISQGGSFGVAAGIGIVGISTLKKYVLDKMNANSNTNKNE